MLRLAISAELIPTLTFNYLSVHSQCMKVLRVIHCKLRSFVERERPGFVDPDPPVDLLAAFVLMNLGRHADAETTRTSLEDHFKVDCEALNPFIECEGVVENQQMVKLDEA